MGHENRRKAKSLRIRLCTFSVHSPFSFRKHFKFQNTSSTFSSASRYISIKPSNSTSFKLKLTSKSTWCYHLVICKKKCSFLKWVVLGDGLSRSFRSGSHRQLIKFVNFLLGFFGLAMFGCGDAYLVCFCIYQEKGGDKSKRKWKLWRGTSEGFGIGSSLQKGQSGGGSFVVDDGAFAAALAAVVRTPLKDFMVIKQEWAAIRIQAVFRGFLVSRTLF